MKGRKMEYKKDAAFIDRRRYGKRRGAEDFFRKSYHWGIRLYFERIA
jgi:hypothetical protein